MSIRDVIIFYICYSKRTFTATIIVTGFVRETRSETVCRLSFPFPSLSGAAFVASDEEPLSLEATSGWLFMKEPLWEAVCFN